MLSAIFCAVAALCSIPAAHAKVLVYEGFHAADYGNKTGSNSTTASNGNTTGDYTVGVALGGWSANGTSTVRVTGPANGLALPEAMTDAGFTAVGCAIGMSTESKNTKMKCMYHNLTEGALGVSSGTLYFRMLLAVDPKTAQVLAAGESLAEKDGGYYGFGFGVAPTANNSYAPTSMNSALSFVIWRKAKDQYVLSLVHTTADSTTFTSYPIIDGISPSTTYVCYAEVKVGAGTDGKELIRAGAMAAGDYATSIPWATLDGSSDTVGVELISESSYPTCMAVAGPYGSNGRFRADEIVVGTKLGDVLRADGAFTVAPSGTPTIGQTTFSSDWKLIAGTDVTADAEIVYSTDSSFATATTNALGTGLSAGTHIASLTGLEPDTTYWWKVSADKSGERNESFAKSFRTTGAPILGEVSATTDENAITFSSALAEAALGNTLDTTVSVFYGTDGETWTELQLDTTSSAQIYADTVSDLTYGMTYRWYVRASATSGNRTFEAVSATNSVTVLHTGDLYVNVSTSNAIAPYSTPETAAPNIKTALDIATDGSTIHVAPGRYAISTPLSLTKAVELVGDNADPSRVIVSNTAGVHYYNQNQRCIRLNHADAVVSGITFENGRDYGNGGNVRIDTNGGIVTNCILSGGFTREGNDSAGANVAIMGPGLVTHCRILGGDQNNCEDGDRVSSVYLEHANARIENCLVRGFQGSTVSHQPTVGCAGIVVNKGAAVNCTVMNCTSPYTTDSGFAGILVWANGVATNCVSVSNVDSNGIVRAFAPSQVSRTSHCAFDAIAGETTIPEGMPNAVVGTAESFFNDYANGDYTPKAGGPLVGKGANYEDMASVDLAGKKRLNGSKVDIGCYEGVASGISIRLR